MTPSHFDTEADLLRRLDELDDEPEPKASEWPPPQANLPTWAPPGPSKETNR